VIFLLPAALAGTPTITLTATLRDDLQTITGELIVEDGEGVRFIDALSMLPQPESDTVALRTWPRDPEQGWVDITERDRDTLSFYAILPRRYDASGLVPGRGVFLNGLWHPQPVRGTALEDATWDVTLTLPDGVVGTLNGTYGTGELHWQGHAERLAISAIPGGEIRRMPLEAGELVVVDSRARPRLDERLTAMVEDSWPGPMAPDALVVVTPSRRRLCRPGPDVLFLSDRAFRATGGLWRYHLPAVRLGLLSASLPIEESWQRHLAAAAISERLYTEPTPEELLGWFSWIPQIDDLLYDGRMPFFSEIFNETWPGDPLADDLQEIVDRRIPARALLHRIDALYGEGSTYRLATALLSGRSLHEATIAAGVPPAVLSDWLGWEPAAELSVDVEELTDESWRITVDRVAEDRAPVEPVVVVIDEVERRLLLGPGSDRAIIEQPYPPSAVQIDPDRQLLQVDRSDDRWPERWTAVVSFFPYELNLRTARLSAYANLGLRRQYSTLWRYDLGVYTDPENLIGTSVRATRYLGPLIDRRYRVLRVWGGVGSAVLDADFRPITGSPVVTEAFLGTAWDTRERLALVRSGHRISAAVGAGMIPGSTERWASTGMTLLAQQPLGGRVVAVGRVKGGLASGDLEHRLLALGGSSAVQGLPPAAMLGNDRAVASGELRWLALHNVSVPIPLAWVSEMQVSGGADVGTSSRDGVRTSAVGWSGGLGFVADIVGADPNFGGIWVAGPVWVTDETLADGLQVYVRISQPF
jgi:hypothetical protein